MITALKPLQCKIGKEKSKCWGHCCIHDISREYVGDKAIRTVAVVE